MFSMTAINEPKRAGRTFTQELHRCDEGLDKQRRNIHRNLHSL
jgi:hypothetical protein